MFCNYTKNFTWLQSVLSGLIRALLTAELKWWLMSKNYFLVFHMCCFQCSFERNNCIHGRIKLLSLHTPLPQILKYSVQLVSSFQSCPPYFTNPPQPVLGRINVVFWFESIIKSSSLSVLDILWTKTEEYAMLHSCVKHMDCFLPGIEPRLWKAFGF